MLQSFSRSDRDNFDILLSSIQLDQFRSGQGITSELEICGKRGAFFVNSELELSLGGGASWHIVADVNQDFAQINNTKYLLHGNQKLLKEAIETDIDDNTAHLNEIIACADGIQLSADKAATTHHFANVMFNLMRGGIFYDQYWVNKKYFTDYIQWHNKALLDAQADFLQRSLNKFIFMIYINGQRDRGMLTHSPFLHLSAPSLQPTPWRPQPPLEPIFHQYQE